MRSLRQAQVPLPITHGAPKQSLLRDLWQDLRYAARMLRKQPVFAAAAVLTLALGIGANTAIFSLVNATLLQRLPVADRDRLVYVHRGNLGGVFSYPLYEALRDNNHSFEGFAAWSGISASLNAGGETELVNGAIVTGNFFDVLGITAGQGRLLSPRDDVTPGGHPVAVISHDLWQTHFGGRPDIVGRDVRLNGHVFTIVGVTSAAFHGPQLGSVRHLYVPMMMQAIMRPPGAGYSGEQDPDLLEDRRRRIDGAREPTLSWLSGLGRLEPGITLEQARAELATLATTYERTFDPSDPPERIALVPIDEGDPRQRERLQAAALLLGGVVAAVALGLAVIVGALFSAGPAWFMSRTPPLEALSGVGRSGQLRSFIPRRSLVVAQVALSFVLLSGAGLLASSLGRLEAEELGFEPEGRTIVQINPPPLAGERERLARLYTNVRDRLLRIPGVQDASYALYSPMEGNNWSGRISIAGRPVDPASPDGSSWNRVGPRYFETVGTRLLRGRVVEEAEITGGAPVAVINDAFRRRFFTDTEPIGQRLGIGGAAQAGDYEVVGVVDDVRYTAPRDPVRPMIFLPAFQAVEYAEPVDAAVQARSMLLRTLIVHASADPAALEPAIRRAIAEVDPEIHVIRVRPHAEQVSLNFRIEQLMARLTSMYGLLALVLASLGLYGVTAFGVAQRTREIGVRMALGADRSRIVRTVVRGPVGQTLAGLVIGVPLALAASRSIAAQLYGVGSEDPVVFGAATVVLLASTVIAAIIPAFRAASINPTQALRGD